MTMRPRAHILEDQSIIKLESSFPPDWTVERLKKDYGEDLLIRIFKNGKATQLSFFVQAKSTDNIQKYQRSDGTSFSYPVQTKHIEHWATFWEPVIITLWDSKKDVTYWACIQTFVEGQAHDRKAKRTHKTLRVTIPKCNTLDAKGIKRIQRLTESRFARFDREREGANKLIRILEDHLGIQIEYEPQFGFLQVPKGKFIADPSGGETIFPFGIYAATLDLLEREFGLSWEESTTMSLKLLVDYLKKVKDDPRRFPPNPFLSFVEKLISEPDAYLQIDT